jgi:hypothetical protein
MPDGMRGDGGGGARRGMCDHSCPFPSASQTVGWHIHIIDCMPSSFAQGVLGTGLLVGGDTYAYQVAPPEMVEKARRWGVLCEQHGVCSPRAFQANAWRSPLLLLIGVVWQNGGGIVYSFRRHAQVCEPGGPWDGDGRGSGTEPSDGER